MKRAGLAIVVSLGACGFDGNAATRDASVADDGAPSSDGSDADGRPSDAAIDGSFTLDTDSDGLADAVDNCPFVSNQDQRNYDADPRGDVCDPCPHLANQDDDPDADDIGAGCDPRPADQDQRLAWTSFHDASTIANWSFLTGTWLVESGKLRQTNPTVDYALASPPLSPQRLYIATRYTVDAHGPRDSTVGSTGLGVSSANAAGNYNACIIARGSATNLYAASNWPGGDGTDDLDFTAWPHDYDAGARVDVVHDTLASNHCVATQASNRAEIASARTPSIDGAIYLYTQRAAGYFEFMFVVGIP